MIRSLVFTLLLAVPALSHAQSTSQVASQNSSQRTSQSFAYLRGTDTLGVETVTISSTAITGDLVLTGAPRVMWTHERQGTVFGALSLKVFTPGAAANSAPAQEGTVRIAGDSASLVMSAGTRSQSQTLPIARGAVALVNASVVHAALIGANAAKLNQGNVPLFLTSGGQTVTAAIAGRGDTLLVTINGAESRVVMAADGLPREIAVPSQSARVVRMAAGTAQAPAMITYEAPTGAPYTAESVKIPTERGYELAGTLTRPVLNRTVAVVVTISGSGPQERDGRLAVVPGYAPFREIADTLARRGIATLRFDDRGVGASGGLESARSATSADLADDVRSIIAWLKKRGDIDARNIVLAGHSEGGLIAPMVAATSLDVRAIALLAGPAYSGRRVSMMQNKESIDGMGIAQARRDSIMATVPAQLDKLGESNKWFGFYLSYDPLVTARQVKQPVLVLQGATDRQVSPEQADTLAAALRSSGNTMVTTKVFPATNHLFLADSSGAFTGYGALKDTKLRKEVLGALADWVLQVTTRK
ncbi:MAG: alpha/beta fold hydrolase [Gemmatimonadota bacterium]